MHRSNRLVIDTLEKVLDMKREELSKMPVARTPELKKQKQSRGFAIRALESAITILSAHDEKITSGASVEHLAGIGKGVSRRIDETLATGTLDELKDYIAVADPKRDKLVRDSTASLSTVFGLGPAGARKYVEMGIYSPAQLRLAVKAGSISVNDAVKAGLEFHKDLLERIPRKEMDAYDKLFKTMISDLPRGTKLSILGSYRRGLPDCGDVDVLLSGPKPDAGTLKIFLDRLAQMGILAAYLSEGKAKFAGIIKVPEFDKARRLDVREVSGDEYPFAQLYFTGSMESNVTLRLRARSMGLSLSEYGIKDVKSGEYVKGLKSERDIFKYLGLNYVKPQDR